MLYFLRTSWFWKFLIENFVNQFKGVKAFKAFKIKFELLNSFNILIFKQLFKSLLFY